MKTDRLLGLCDAVIAIAATIMVLELEVPDGTNIGALITQWPIFLAHFNSFFIIYILWYNHDDELAHTDTVSPKTVLLTGVWLAVISVLPFTTGWVGKEPDATLPEILYTLTACTCSILYNLMYRQIAKENPDLAPEAKSAIKKRIPVFLGYFISFGLAIVKPILSMITVFIVVLLMVIQILRDKTVT